MSEDEIRELVASFRVVHLQPDDVLVVAAGRPIDYEVARNVQQLFSGRKVVVLDDGVHLGVAAEGIL